MIPIDRLSHFTRLSRFGLIGILAAATHYSIVIALVEYFQVTPMQANVGGFGVAFWMSYLGHRHWTFSDHSTTVHRSLIRFFTTALFGFGLNTFLYYLGLRYLDLPYFITLALVIFIVAITTYFLSTYWAFTK